MKLLLIEDDAITVESIKICAEVFQPDTKIETTGKGIEAIRMLKKGDYNAVIIDLGLPDIDGTEVIKELRRFSNIPAIVLSASAPAMIRTPSPGPCI
jgi:DNA-binding response OmpR family regulator